MNSVHIKKGLGQENYLTSRDRLELDKELTRLQAEMSFDTARMKLR